MRAALARALLQKVDLLILDEPTNFLDLRAIIWLQSHLVALRDSEAGTTVLLVSHDREFVDTVAEEVILVKDQGLEYFRGNLSAYEEDFRSRVLNLTRMQEAQGKETARLEKSIQQTIKIGKKTGDDNKLRMAKSRQKKLEDGAGMQVNEKGQRFKLSDRMGEDALSLPMTNITTNDNRLVREQTRCHRNPQGRIWRLHFPPPR